VASNTLVADEIQFVFNLEGVLASLTY